jgi:FtsH-binding integral membrane protein
MSYSMRDPSRSAAATRDEGLRAFFVAVYARMGMALAVSAATALIVASSPTLLELIFGTPLHWVVLFAPLAMALFMGRVMINSTPAGATGWLLVFAAIMGVTLSSMLIIYTGESVARALLITACTFGAASLFGYTTGTDLSRMGGILMMAVIGLIIASVINIFLQSSGAQFVISALVVLVFTGLAAWDTQRLRVMYLENGGAPGQMAALGALSLYLDVVNIFVALLSLTGQRR